MYVHINQVLLYSIVVMSFERGSGLHRDSGLQSVVSTDPQHAVFMETGDGLWHMYITHDHSTNVDGTKARAITGLTVLRKNTKIIKKIIIKYKIVKFIIGNKMYIVLK